MKLLVFAHKPPPHHGQSYMVQLLLDVLGGDRRGTPGPAVGASVDSASERGRIECYHVDCRFSDSAEDIGTVRWRKVARLLRFCLQAAWCRFRFGVRNFLYIPAPGLRSAVYRDWLLAVFCRLFFSRRVYYWQAAGLSDWLETQARPWERWLTEGLLGHPDLGIALGEAARRDPAHLRTKRIEIVPNAVPDPCPDFFREILPIRQSRATHRLLALKGLPAPAAPSVTFRVLYLSLCLREKGLFDVVEAVALANRKLIETSSPIRIRFDVAGKFWHEAERLEFEERINRPDLNGPLDGTTVVHHGFAAGDDKARLFRECDCFCFPTYYWAESFPLALLEAMAWGLPIISTKWRNIPEMLPTGHAEFVEPKSPEQIAAAILAMLARDYDPALRARYLQGYTVERYADNLRRVLGLLDGGADAVNQREEKTSGKAS